MSAFHHHQHRRVFWNEFSIKTHTKNWDACVCMPTWEKKVACAASNLVYNLVKVFWVLGQDLWWGMRMLSEIIWSDKYNHHTFVISSCLESNVKRCLLEHTERSCSQDWTKVVKTQYKRGELENESRLKRISSCFNDKRQRKWGQDRNNVWSTLLHNYNCVWINVH